MRCKCPFQSTDYLADFQTKSRKFFCKQVCASIHAHLRACTDDGYSSDLTDDIFFEFCCQSYFAITYASDRLHASVSLVREDVDLRSWHPNLASQMPIALPV